MLGDPVVRAEPTINLWGPESKERLSMRLGGRDSHAVLQLEGRTAGFGLRPFGLIRVENLLATMCTRRSWDAKCQWRHIIYYQAVV